MRLIATGVGTSLAMQGNILGPIFVHFDFQYSAHSVPLSSNRLGLSLRNGFLKKIQANGMMESLTLGASIIGLMVVGAMTATMITINIPLKNRFRRKCCDCSKYFLMILSQISLCLGAFGVVFYLLKRSKTIDVLSGLAFFGIFGSWIGIFLEKEQRKWFTMQDYIYEEKEVLSTILKKNDFRQKTNEKKQRIC